MNVLVVANKILKGGGQYIDIWMELSSLYSLIL